MSFFKKSCSKGILHLSSMTILSAVFTSTTMKLQDDMKSARSAKLRFASISELKITPRLKTKADNPKFGILKSNPCDRMQALLHSGDRETRRDNSLLNNLSKKFQSRQTSISINQGTDEPLESTNDHEKRNFMHWQGAFHV